MGSQSGDPADTIMEDQHLPPQHTNPDVPVVRMLDFWPHVATCWFLVPDAQFRVHRIGRQDVRYAIVTQWPTEVTAISVSDLLLGPMSDTSYTDLKMAILHQTSRAKQPNSTNQTYTEPHLKDSQLFSFATVVNTETMHTEELEVIPEQPTTCIESTVHPSNLHKSPVTLCDNPDA